jgi:hypothetical protein
MQKARGQGPHARRHAASPLPPLVGTQFQVLFHPPSGVLFTFPSRYSFAIGHRRVFSLGRRSSQIQPGFHVSRPTQVRHHASTSDLSPTGLSPPTAELPSSIRLDRTRDAGIRSPPRHRPTTPQRQRLRPLTPLRFGLFPFRSPLLRESRLLSSPPGTEMFQFPGFASGSNEPDDGVHPRRVSPFGHPRIKACLRLPEAYRSLPRPSSPACAKASTACPYSLKTHLL